MADYVNVIEFRALKLKYDKVYARLAHMKQMNDILENIRNYSIVLLNECHCPKTGDHLKVFHKLNRDFTHFKAKQLLVLGDTFNNMDTMSEIASEFGDYRDCNKIDAFEEPSLVETSDAQTSPLPHDHNHSDSRQDEHQFKAPKPRSRRSKDTTKLPETEEQLPNGHNEDFEPDDQILAAEQEEPVNQAEEELSEPEVEVTGKELEVNGTEEELIVPDATGDQFGYSESSETTHSFDVSRSPMTSTIRSRTVFTVVEDIENNTQSEPTNSSVTPQSPPKTPIRLAVRRKPTFSPIAIKSKPFEGIERRDSAPNTSTPLSPQWSTSRSAAYQSTASPKPQGVREAQRPTMKSPQLVTQSLVMAHKTAPNVSAIPVKRPRGRPPKKRTLAMRAKERAVSQILTHDQKHHKGPKPKGREPKISAAELTSSMNNLIDQSVSVIHGIQEGDHKCSHCGALFPSALKLLNHMSYKHKIRSFVCDLCGYRTTQTYYLKRHKTCHTDDKPFTCDIPGCDKTFKTRQIVLAHKKQCHTPERPFECRLCDYKAITKSRLDSHWLTHSQDKPCQCDVQGCEKWFKTPVAVYQHKVVVHSGKTFHCDHPGCDRTYKSKYALEVHRKLHSATKEYFCNINGCTKGFKEKRALKRHQSKCIQNFLCAVNRQWPTEPQSGQSATELSIE